MISFPLKNVESGWLPPKMVSLVCNFFECSDFDLETFLYHASEPLIIFNLTVKASWPQRMVVELHEKLNQKGWLGLWCLALMANGLKPDVMLRDGNYEGGTFCVGTKALDMQLPESDFWHQSANHFDLLRTIAPMLIQHSIARFASSKSSRFSFPHKIQINALLAMAIIQNSGKLPELIDQITPLPMMGEEFIQTFALYGKPSTKDITTAGVQLLEWKQALTNSGKNLSRGFIGDFISSLTNCAYYWILLGIPVVDVVEEVQRRLDCLMPVLYPNRKASSQKAHIQNQLGRLLAKHPEAWGFFGFSACDLLGPSVLDHLECYTSKENEYEDVLEGFLSRYYGLDFQKFAVKKFCTSHPEIRSPLNVVRIGTRCTSWSSPENSYALAAAQLDEMSKHDIYHPVLNGATSASVLNEDSCKKLLVDFLSTGSQQSRLGSLSAIERYPSLIDAVLPLITTKTKAKRLASIHVMTTEQMETFSLELKAVIFHASLGL